MILVVSIAFAIQIHRNILLTGYPLYPFEHISVPVKWKMEKEEVGDLSRGISNWAKGIRRLTDSEDLEKIKKEWMKSRLFVQHRRVETLYPLSLAIIGLVFVVFSNRLSWKKLSIFMLPALGQVGMWYFHSPDTRFASFAFWWLGAALVSFIVKDLFPRKLFLLLPIVVLLFSFSIHTIDALGQEKEIIIIQSSDYVPTVPKTFIYTTDSGLEVLVPKNGEKCDDCPLPCTMTPSPNLKLLESGKMRSGFYLE